MEMSMNRLLASDRANRAIPATNVICVLACVCTIALYACESRAQARTSAGQLAAKAIAFIEHQGTTERPLHATVNRLDPRWSAAACDGELTAFSPPGARLAPRTTVGVRCDGPAPWTFYLSVSVSADARVAVARSALPRGAPLTADNVVFERRRVAGLGDDHLSALPTRATLALRRPVAAGEPITLAALGGVAAVNRGQTVTLVAVAGPAQVQASGIALADAQIGQRVRAQNPASGRIVEGTVAADGSVILSP
jgi:flagella basal body P-ring formation protein FlgA